MSTSPRDLVARVENAVDRRNIDIDDVRVVSTQGPGTTVRIVAEDAPDETDQVGVQVDRPDHPMGENMFSDALRNALNQIEAYYSPEDTPKTDDPTRDTETTDTETEDGFDPDAFREKVDATTKEDADDSSLKMESKSTPRDSPSSVSGVKSQLQRDEVTSDATVAGTELSINVTLDEESFDELQAELDDWLDDVETRVDDVETRMERIEDTLGALGTLGDEK